MRVVFAHDHIFRVDNKGNVFSNGKLPYTVLSRYLDFFDHVTVVSRSEALQNEGQCEQFNIASGKGVSFIPVPSLSRPIYAFIHRREAVARITEAIRGADAVIARLPSEIGSLAIIIAKKLNKPCAVEVVACAWDALWNYGNIQGKIYALYAKKRMQVQIKEATHVLYVTDTFLQTRYPSEGKTGSCSDVEISPLNKEEWDNRIRLFFKNPNVIRFGMMGSLSSKLKGIETALYAFHSIKDEIPFEFHILGDGDKKKWESLANKLGIKPFVFFDGTLPNGKQVTQWLDKIDVYIQPSFQEGLSRAIVEAMSRGCPAIVSNVGGNPELIDFLCLHKPGDSDSLARMLKKATNKKWRYRHGRRNLVRSYAFNKETLDIKRKQFWTSFVVDIQKKQQIIS